MKKLVEFGVFDHSAWFISLFGSDPTQSTNNSQIDEEKEKSQKVLGGGKCVETELKYYFNWF